MLTRSEVDNIYYNGAFWVAPAEWGNSTFDYQAFAEAVQKAVLEGELEAEPTVQESNY
jgi:hypothetical protein